MNFRWEIVPKSQSEIKGLVDDLNVSELLARCLLNRGLSNSKEARLFLEPRLKNLASPLELPNMSAAIKRLFEARNENEKLLIFGDYDVDGITATALLVEVMTEMGWKIEAYLPHRLNEGYGLSRTAVERCLERFSPSIFLAVDCGSNARETIEYLKGKGIDVIVLDHHQISKPFPEAVALVNPHISNINFKNDHDDHKDHKSHKDRNDHKDRSDHNFNKDHDELYDHDSRFCELCSVGLAFKLAHAILMECRKLKHPPSSNRYDLRPLLDLVALGTVADLVPLIRENRILVSSGMHHLAASKRKGLLALMEVANVKKPIGVFEIGFQLAPRINASGRLEDAMISLSLLLCSDFEKAKSQAIELDQCNRQRQRIEKSITDEATANIENAFDPKRDLVIVEGKSDWHPGVVGIVASRVLRAFYRPTIILGGEGGELRGSGRSIDGFDLAKALRSCDDLLLRHGGHSKAAGLSILPERLPEFRKRINEYARDNLSPKALTPSILIDAFVPLSAMALSQIEELFKLKPFGMGNAPLQFVAKKVSLKGFPRRIGREGEHVKFWISDGEDQGEVLWWGCGKRELPSGFFDLAFTPQINEYKGRRGVQLKLLDWKPSSET